MPCCFSISLMTGPMSLKTAQPLIGSVIFSPWALTHIPSGPFL